MKSLLKMIAFVLGMALVLFVCWVIGSMISSTWDPFARNVAGIIWAVLVFLYGLMSVLTTTSPDE